MENTAGILSIANKTSLNSITIKHIRSGVTYRLPSIFLQKNDPLL